MHSYRLRLRVFSRPLITGKELEALCICRRYKSVTASLYHLSLNSVIDNRHNRRVPRQSRIRPAIHLSPIPHVSHSSLIELVTTVVPHHLIRSALAIRTRGRKRRRNVDGDHTRGSAPTHPRYLGRRMMNKDGQENCFLLYLERRTTFEGLMHRWMRPFDNSVVRVTIHSPN